MRTLWQDLRYSARSIRQSPSLTLVILLTVAVGVGANTSIFSAFQSMVLRPLPGVEQAQDLLSISMRSSAAQNFPLSYPLYKMFKEGDQNLSDSAAEFPIRLALQKGENTVRLHGEIVTGDYFNVLRVRPHIGRVLTPDDDRVVGGHAVAVLSYDLWKNEFGANEAIVGTSILINGRRFTVVGVTREGFVGANVGLRSEIFVPVMMQQVVFPVTDGENMLGNPDDCWLIGLTRLKPGVSVEQLRATLREITTEFTERFPDAIGRGLIVSVSHVRDSPIAAAVGLLPTIPVFMVTAILFLLLACINVGALLLANVTKRQTEIGLQLALGASPIRIARQFLAHSLMLSLSGGCIGLFLTLWLNAILRNSIITFGVPLHLEASLDVTVFCFMLVISIVSGAVFGFAPIFLVCRMDPVTLIKGVGRVNRSTSPDLRRALVAAQVAISFVLVIGSGLLVRSLIGARAAKLGFDANDVLVASVDTQPAQLDKDSRTIFFRRVVEQSGTLPAVESAALSQTVPLAARNGYSFDVLIEGYQPAGNENMTLDLDIVSPGYFNVLRIPILEGRDFNWNDNSGSPRVAIVNERMARTYWPGKSPIGRRMRGEGKYWYTIVGVVGDSKYNDVADDSHCYFYLSASQTSVSEMYLFVKTLNDPISIKIAAAKKISEIDSRVAVSDVKTMQQRVQAATSGYAVGAKLLSIAGLLGLCLAVMGVFATVSYSISAKTREIGVRVALGADSRTVLWTLLVQETLPSVIGILAGIATAAWLSRFLRALLFGVSPTDPVTFAIVAVAILGATVVACLIPVSRVLRIDTARILRDR